jgi:hypothetical protein
MRSILDANGKHGGRAVNHAAGDPKCDPLLRFPAAQPGPEAQASRAIRPKPETGGNACIAR